MGENKRKQRYYDRITQISIYLKGKYIPLIFIQKYQLFATGGGDRKITVVSNSLEVMGCLNGHNSDIMCLEYLTNRKLASGSWDNIIKIWDLDRKCIHATLYPYLHTEGISALCSPKPGVLVSGSFDKTLIIWDIREKEEGTTSPRVLIGHKFVISGIVRINSEQVISGDYSTGELRVWNFIDAVCIRVIPPPENAGR